MTNSEFSNEFDVLYNSITSNKAPGLDEYEKSVFLTKAQEELVKAFFSPKSNKVQEGFDMSQKRQYDFSSLLKSAVVNPISTAALTWIAQNKLDYLLPTKIDSRSKLFMAPTDLFLSINEIIKDSTNMQYTVSPISYSEYHRCMLKPYSYPPKRLAWRIISDNSTITGVGGDLDVNIIFRNKCSKPLTINIQFISDSSFSGTTSADYIKSHPPVVTETDEVTINMFVPRSALTGFWTYYLSSDQALARGNLDKYIYPIGSNKVNGSFPTSVKDSINNITINIGPSVSPIFEILGKFNGAIEYNIRYVRIPKPIILIDLEDDNLSINGYTSKTECELPPGIHSEILQRAVELAKTAYEVQEGASYIQTSSISATDKGVVANT